MKIISEQIKKKAEKMYLDGISVPEISKWLGISESTVRNCAHNMTDEWKQEFAKEWDETREAFYR